MLVLVREFPGQRTLTDNESPPPVEPPAEAPASPSVTRAEAIAIAKKRVGNGRVDDVDRDDDDGRAIWEVDIIRGRTEFQVDIDATTGTILEIDRDTDD